MDHHRVKTYRWATVIVCGLTLAAMLASFPITAAARKSAYEAGAANGFIRGACYAAGEFDAAVAGEMADDCEAAEQRHTKRLGRVL
jgi:hypothetical protein